MTLGQAQRTFMKCLQMLLQKIHADGYEVSGDWLYRPHEIAEQYAREGKGIANSNHTIRLAIDLNLFREGVWKTQSEDHEQFGEYWETVHPLARWGGRFGDGNHYSFEWEGRR